MVEYTEEEKHIGKTLEKRTDLVSIKSDLSGDMRLYIIAPTDDDEYELLIKESSRQGKLIEEYTISCSEDLVRILDKYKIPSYHLFDSDLPTKKIINAVNYALG